MADKNTRESMWNESRLQSEMYIWFHNTYPDLRGCMCYNLNNAAHKIAGVEAKAMGLQAGRSDMVLYFNGIAYMIEVKTPDGTQSKNQKEWQSIIEAQGFEYYIVRTLDEFKSLILTII